MGMYSKLFYAKYCLSNIFTIISDMEINIEKKKKKKKTHCQKKPKIQKKKIKKNVDLYNLISYNYLKREYIKLTITHYILKT